MTPNRLFILILIIFSNISLYAQFRINQLSSEFEKLNDPLFLGVTSTRSIQSLNNNWKSFFPENPDNFSEVNFPISFTSEQPIIFEKQFNISADDLLKNTFKLNFLGINYAAEIFLNNVAVYKHPGGEIPFSIDISSNLLNYDSPNILRIIIQYNIDPQNTIPLLQRFLFPQNFGGILRDVYLSSKPKVGIKDLEFNIAEDSKPYEGRLNIQVNLEEFNDLVSDSLLENYDGRFKLEALVQKTTDTSKIYFNIWNINPTRTENYDMSFYVRLRNLIKWSTKTPESYFISVKLTNGDGFVYDEFNKVITQIDFQKKNKDLLLNEKSFDIEGVTYIRSLNKDYNYSIIESDIKTIKEAGFNTIRFSKAFPHPYSVYLCEKYGLFALIEVPLNSVPENFVDDDNFHDRTLSFLNRTIKYYDQFPFVIGYSVGGSYLSNSENHINFISKMNKAIKKMSPNKFTYTSFIGLNENSEVNTDLYGIEIYSSNPLLLIEEYGQKEFSDSLIYFISEATYPTYKGNTNGYLNDYSFEGQAKFFDDVITASRETNIKGFVLNSMFDYKGDFSPLYSGNSNENIYQIGILPIEGNKSRISYNLVKSRLVTGSKISIPIGNNEEDAPLFFIIAALIISVIIALLINSKRKFREDTTRALLRPYNFFADVRDQRILSSFHSNILILLLAGSNALLITILLYFFKNNILVEKILLAFGNNNLISNFSSFAWNPQLAFIYIYIATIVIFILISFLVHLSSFFVKTRVLYSSVYSVAIWAFLPLALLLPIEAVLYKVLITQSYNYIIYIILILFLIWNIQRFIKGVYVIFDVRPIFIYLSAFIILSIIVAGLSLYFQFTVSAFNYISLAVKQYLLL
ncbi:MAG: hypothetical protein H6612_09145 [Ignavibacteriales bacterium]|nr:hypothetical protein [Ignavibacteriales bacterium]